ncbi:hypothetical protein [Yaniella flava]|uniref:hypothetical protein n=1 Tax=Yaniella flava TaxID=287930 RepID=UPI0031DB9A11
MVQSLEKFEGVWVVYPCAATSVIVRPFACIISGDTATKVVVEVISETLVDYTEADF